MKLKLKLKLIVVEINTKTLVLIAFLCRHLGTAISPNDKKATTCVLDAPIISEWTHDPKRVVEMLPASHYKVKKWYTWQCSPANSANC